MCRAAALAAALSLLVLAGVACDPTSLTPFGLEHRRPDPAEGTYSGTWRGTTASGGPVAFMVASGRVAGFTLEHAAPECVLTFELTEKTAPVDNGKFTFDFPLAGQGRLLVKGSFTSPSTCAGTYQFTSLGASLKCPTAASATFTAEKTVD